MTANTAELAQNRPLQFFLSPKEVYFALLQSKVHRPGYMINQVIFVISIIIERFMLMQSQSEGMKSNEQSKVNLKKVI